MPFGDEVDDALAVQSRERIDEDQHGGTAGVGDCIKRWIERDQIVYPV
jgi:hypothetical protein